MNKYDRKHLANIASIQKRIETIYTQAAKEAARIGVRIDSLPADRLFSLDDYPAAKKEIDKLIKELADSVNVAIVNGIRSSWTLSNNKNDEISRQVFGDNVGKLTQAQYRRYFSTNGEALDAFLERKWNGLNLSDRVWRYTEAFKNEIELGLDVGIRNGMSAAEMSRDLRDWLRYPDMLFRRVRDEHGDLQLSQRAAMFHPGQGVYRSSYMNARRLAATETNIAYRTADHERWRDLDFVVGIRVVLSNNHTCLGSDGKPHKFEDICDKLSAEYGSTNTSGQGCYPKDFKFTGWHPHCRCHAESILKTDEEIAEDNRRILEGEEPIDYKQSEKYVKDVPKEFEEWVKDNKQRIDNAKTLPYFLSDNKRRVDALLSNTSNTEATIKRVSQTDTSRKSLTDEQKIRKDEIKKIMSSDSAREYKSNLFAKPLMLYKRSIKEWLNQPHYAFSEKNELLLNLQEVLDKCTDMIPLTVKPKHKDAVSKSFALPVAIGGKNSWVIIHEMKWGEVKIYGISDDNRIFQK